jgi:hypothetical protein
MAYEIPFNYIGVLPANIDFSALQFTAVNVAPSSDGAGVGGGAAVAPAAGGQIIGVIQNNPIAQEAAQIMFGGVSKIKAGGDFVVGDRLMVTAGGLFIKATATNRVVAIAFETGSNGAVSSALLVNLGIEPAA